MAYDGYMAQQFQDLELTPKMADAIMPFVEDPSREWYGGELMRRTGQSSGYLYPTLAKFQKNGWLTSGRENIDPRKAGRPPRRYYKITDAGLASARIQLALLSQRYAPPTTVRPRLAPNAGAL
jgi:DNA-binding MarR family transcriptional regulator